MEWFSIRLEDHRDVPWVKELLIHLDTFTQITGAAPSLELAGNMIMQKHLLKRLQNAGWVCLSSISMTDGQTDNQGNEYILTKHYTNRWPGAAILMEIAATMLATESHMSIGHVPRERNIWADDLANLIFDGFDPDKRWDPIEELQDSLVLNDVLAYGRQLGFHLPRKEREERQRKARLASASLSLPFEGRPGWATESSKRRKTQN